LLVGHAPTRDIDAHCEKGHRHQNGRRSELITDRWIQLVIGVQAANLSAHYGVSVDRLRSVMGANGNLTPTVGACWMASRR
jgi:hypothetical protein